MFDGIEWNGDTFKLAGLSFRVEQLLDPELEDADCFRFCKLRHTLVQYHSFFRAQSSFSPDRIMEIGIWDGGSVALWWELLRPTKYVAVDRSARGDSPYFEKFLDDRGLRHAVKTYWGIDQSDAARLVELVHAEAVAPLDLVIDDASHQYRPTLKSFNALFPLLRPGGFYVIEDWAWDHWEEFDNPDHPWAAQVPLTRLVIDFVEALGSSGSVISNVLVYRDFVAVERGPANLATPLDLSTIIRHRCRPSLRRRLLHSLHGTKERLRKNKVVRTT